MPDEHGRIRPIAVPCVPWHEKRSAFVEAFQREIADADRELDESDRRDLSIHRADENQP